jgi:hypothetical protein
MADSASGSFLAAKSPRLPLTPAVGPFHLGQEFIVVLSLVVGSGISARKRFSFVGIFQAGTA